MNAKFSYPRRGEIYYIKDPDESHEKSAANRTFGSHVQGGSRMCVIVSNNTGNTYSPNVEVVFTTTKKKAKMPTHFLTKTTPRTSLVQCEAIMTVSKTDLQEYYGKLTDEEIQKLNRCLRISLDL